MSALRTAACGLTLAAGALIAQQQYISSNITGQLTRTATVSLLQQAQQVQTTMNAQNTQNTDFPHAIPRLHPPVTQRFSTQSAAGPVQSLAVGGSSVFGFNGLTHADQRLSNGGNQFSIEPPSQGLAVANGFILEGVNNAVQVYSTAGAALLPQAVSTNQLFGLAPAINRATGATGVFPTDIRVFYDQGINRWFVLQRAQDNDEFGNLLNASHLYMAVSQTGDPTAVYNIYTMNTTFPGSSGCPCVPDYPQIGADQYGFYIAANEYDSSFFSFVDATIFAISKASLGAGAVAPPTFRFRIPFSTGFEFAIQPAAVPPGTSNLLASGGVEYLLSTQASFSFDGSVALWAMTNTASMNTQTPNLLLTQTTVPSLNYFFPDYARQRPGPLPYGSSLSPPGTLALLDGNDTRMLSVTYAGGRLYATWASQVFDSGGQSVVGGVYAIITPTYRAGVLSGSVLRQGYLSILGNHLLRPSIAVNAQGRGAIVFTVAGPDYFPSAGFVPIDVASTGSVAQIAAAGASPEDGFSGYPDFGGQGVARWGDYSAATVAPDGVIWMATEYIPNLARTPLANWGTFVMRFIP